MKRGSGSVCTSDAYDSVSAVSIVGICFVRHSGRYELVNGCARLLWRVVEIGVIAEFLIFLMFFFGILVINVR